MESRGYRAPHAQSELQHSTIQPLGLPWTPACGSTQKSRAGCGLIRGIMEDGWDSDDSSSGSEGLGAHGGAGGAVADSGAVGAAGGAGGPAEASDMWFDEVPTPRDLEFPCEVSELAFHPHQDVVAVGLVSGRIEL